MNERPSEEDCICAEVASIAGNHLTDEQIVDICVLSESRLRMARAAMPAPSVEARDDH